jgi:hypothetical protein
MCNYRTTEAYHKEHFVLMKQLRGEIQACKSPSEKARLQYKLDHAKKYEDEICIYMLKVQKTINGDERAREKALAALKDLKHLTKKQKQELAHLEELKVQYAAMWKQVEDHIRAEELVATRLKAIQAQEEAEDRDHAEALKLQLQLDRAAEYERKVTESRDHSYAKRVSKQDKWMDAQKLKEEREERERLDHAFAMRLMEQEERAVAASSSSQPSMAQRIKQAAQAPVPVSKPSVVKQTLPKSDFPALSAKSHAKSNAKAAALAKQEEEDRLLAEAIMRAEQEELAEEERLEKEQEDKDRKMAQEVARLAQEAEEAERASWLQASKKKAGARK